MGYLTVAIMGLFSSNFRETSYLVEHGQYISEYEIQIVALATKHAPIILGLFFFITVPLAYLSQFFEHSYLIYRVASKFIVGLILLLILYLIAGYERGGWEGIFVNQTVIPFIKIIIGSVTVGWIYELFVATIEK